MHLPQGSLEPELPSAPAVGEDALMKLELEYELITDSTFGPRVELSLVDPEHQRRRVIFCEYPNPGYRGGVGLAAFNLVASRLEKALSENPCR